MTNAIFDDDVDETGAFLDNDLGHSDFLQQLNSLEQSVDFRDMMLMWNYAVFGLDLSDVPCAEIYALTKGINAVADDFNTGGKTVFDTS